MRVLPFPVIAEILAALGQRVTLDADTDLVG